MRCMLIASTLHWHKHEVLSPTKWFNHLIEWCKPKVNVVTLFLLRWICVDVYENGFSWWVVSYALAVDTLGFYIIDQTSYSNIESIVCANTEMNVEKGTNIRCYVMRFLPSFNYYSKEKPVETVYIAHVRCVMYSLSHPLANWNGIMKLQKKNKYVRFTKQILFLTQGIKLKEGEKKRLTIRMDDCMFFFFSFVFFIKRKLNGRDYNF